MHFSVSLTLADDRASLTAAGELDAFTAMQVRRCVEDALAVGCRHFTVDVAGVTFVDAAGLGVFVHLRNAAARRGGTVTVVGASPTFRRICGLTGLAAAFRLSAPEKPVEHHLV